jgi:hypothetical protein
MHGHNIKAAVYAQLEQLAAALATKIAAAQTAGLDDPTRAHSGYLDFVLRKALTVAD